MLLNLYNWFIGRNGRKSLCYEKAAKTTKAIEKNEMFKMQINKIIRTNKKSKFVKAKGHKNVDTER